MDIVTVPLSMFATQMLLLLGLLPQSLLVSYHTACRVQLHIPAINTLAIRLGPKFQAWAKEHAKRMRCKIPLWPIFWSAKSMKFRSSE
uniref:Putative secreted protein n=1 Tax=Ixodes ricinus TaxID=34613 RepID=A0A6B0U284_IXORI